jgi:hypothetical protein
MTARGQMLRASIDSAIAARTSDDLPDRGIQKRRRFLNSARIRIITPNSATCHSHSHMRQCWPQERTPAADDTPVGDNRT